MLSVIRDLDLHAARMESTWLAAADLIEEQGGFSAPIRAGLYRASIIPLHRLHGYETRFLGRGHASGAIYVLRPGYGPAVSQVVDRGSGLGDGNGYAYGYGDGSGHGNGLGSGDGSGRGVSLRGSLCHPGPFRAHPWTCVQVSREHPSILEEYGVHHEQVSDHLGR